MRKVGIKLTKRDTDTGVLNSSKLSEGTHSVSLVPNFATFPINSHATRTYTDGICIYLHKTVMQWDNHDKETKLPWF